MQKQLAPLKSATDMGDCADAFVMLAKNGFKYIYITPANLEREHYRLRVNHRCWIVTHVKESLIHQTLFGVLIVGLSIVWTRLRLWVPILLTLQPNMY